MLMSWLDSLILIMQTIEPAKQLNMKYYKNVLRQRRFKHVITAIYSMTSTLIVLCAIPLSCDFGKLNLTVDCALPEKWWDACAVKGCDMNAVWNFLSIWCILICMSRFPLKTEMLLSLLDAFKTINVVLKDYFCASEVKSRIRVSSSEGFPATLRSTLPVLLENGLL